MKLTEAKLKELYQRQTARTQRRPAGCLTEEQFVRVAIGELSQQERLEAAQHLSTCSDCTEEYRLIQALKPWAKEAEQVTALGSPARLTEKPGGLAAKVRAVWQPLTSVYRWQVVTAALIVMVAAGASIILWQNLGLTEDAVSSERGGSSVPMKIDPLDRATLSAAPDRLAWSAVGAAESYQVSLYDFESTPIWESPRVSSTSVLLPQEVRQRLQPGQRYYWRVIAQSATERRQSELFQFVIAR